LLSADGAVVSPAFRTPTAAIGDDDFGPHGDREGCDADIDLLQRFSRVVVSDHGEWVFGAA